MSNTGDSGDIRIGFQLAGDPAQAQAEADRMAKIIGDGLVQGFSQFGPKLAKEIVRSLNKGGQAFKGFTDTAVTSARKTSDAIEELTKDTDALNKRVAATRAQLAKVGAEPELFAVIDRELQKVQSSFRAFNSDIERIADNPDLLDGYEIAFRNAQQTIFREIAGIQSQLRNLSAVQRTEGNRANEIASRQLQERNIQARAANSRYIVETQGSNAQILAETRAANQRIIQQERIKGRTRTELVRFTFQQIRVLERGIASAFRGTAAVLEGTIRTIQRSASRMGNLFRRSNADLNEGLGGALIKRESSISRSFNRQTRQVTAEITKQSAVIQRFEAQASTGIAGAVTGRSALGGLLGGGLAIGGGIGFVAGIRNQIKVGGDFVQGLAVMQAQLKLTDEAMAAVRIQSIELGNDISLPGVSALDAAQAIQILGKQFASLGSGALPAAQAAARGVLQLSRAMGVQAEEAARVVGAAVNVFGASANQATAIADQVTNAMSLAAGVGFNDFADAFTQSASVVNLFIGPAQDATDALAELNAAVATLAKGGIIGSDAGTSIKQFFLQANRGTVDATEKMEELTARAGETGSAFFDASGRARTLAEAISILERGTRGLSDQARTQTLQKLFGSDAARAAAILINQGAAAFRNLTESVKEQGSAARIAAAQNTGLRGALDALQSVIETQQIKTYEKYQKTLGNVVVAFAELLNQFFEGEGIFRVIRASLLGLGVALGALLAAKAAAESIKFLSIAMGGLVSPLGIVVGGLAILGAAIGGLSAISPAFRTEMAAIRDDLRGRFGEAVTFVADNLADLSEFVRTKALPPFVDFAVGVAQRVIPIIQAAADEIGLLAGAFQSGLSGEGITSSGIIGFMERLGVGLRQAGIAAQAFRAALGSREFTTVLTSSGVLNEERQTAFVRFAERLGQAVGGLRSALKGEGVTSNGLVGFGERVGVALRQAAIGADAFKTAISGQEFSNVLTTAGFLNEERQTFFVKALETLGATLRIVGERIIDIGDALRDVFTGDRTVGSILTAIGGMFSGAFTAIVGVLEPQLQAVVGFVGDFLAGAASTAAGAAGSSVEQFLTGPFQQAATALGFFLGNLASDPRLVEALEKLIGLAILTGVNFVKGLFQGIGSNLDELAGLFGKQLFGAVNGAIEAAFRNPLAFAKIIAAGLLGATILRAWSGAGRRGAQETISGFTRGMRLARGALGSAAGAIRGTGGASSFITGFFGGPGALEKAGAAEAAKVKRQMVKVFQSINRDLSALGQTTGGRFKVIDEKAIEEANQRLLDTRARLGDVASDARIARVRLDNAFGGMAQAARGFFTILKGDANGGAVAVRTGFERMKLAVVDSFNDLVAQTGSKAKAVGSILGAGIMGGVSAALSGQQLGNASSAGGAAIGLAGIIGSALFSGLSLGGAPGVAVGAAVGAIGLVTAAFAASGRAAKQAEEDIKDWADTLRDTGGIVRAQKAAEKMAADLGDLGSEVQAATEGLDVFALTQEAIAGDLTKLDVFARLAANAGVSNKTIEAVTARMTEMGTSSLTAFKVIGDGTDELDALTSELGKNKITVKGLADAQNSLTGDTEDLTGALGRLDWEGTVITGADEAAESINGVDTAVRGSITAMEAGRNQADRYVEGLLAAAGPTARLDEAAQRMAERAITNFDNVRTAIDEINRANVDNLNTRIGNLTQTLENVRSEAALTLESILALVGGPAADPLVDSLNNLLLTIPQIAPALERIQAEGIVFDDDTVTIAEAEVLNQLQPFYSAVQERMKAAIESGAFDGLTGEALDAAQRALFADFERELGSFQVEVKDAEGNVSLRPLTDAETGFILDIIQGQVESKPLDAGIERLNLLDGVQENLQQQLDALKAELNVRLVIDPQQVQSMLTALGLPFLTLKQIENLIPFQPDPTLPVTDTLQGGGRISGPSLTDIAKLVAEAQDIVPGGTRRTGSVDSGSLVPSNTVVQNITYNTVAAEVPVMSPADAQRTNRAAATGLLAILPGTLS